MSSDRTMPMHRVVTEPSIFSANTMLTGVPGMLSGDKSGNCENLIHRIVRCIIRSVIRQDKQEICLIQI